MTYHEHPHRDVDKWARVARQIRADQRPAEERPKPRPHRYDQPTLGDHRAWDLALARPCERHGAEAGSPCWDGAVRGMCAARTNTTGHDTASRRGGAS